MRFYTNSLTSTLRGVLRYFIYFKISYLYHFVDFADKAIKTIVRLLKETMIKNCDDQQLIETESFVYNSFRIDFSSIFVRNCYKKLYEHVLIFSHEKSTHDLVLIGTPGIGKTYFSYYLIKRFLDENRTFVFEPFQKKNKYGDYWVWIFYGNPGPKNWSRNCN